MERALRYEILKHIPSLSGEIYPANAPKTCRKPYLVYMRTGTDRIKLLDGYTDKQSLSYMFNAMAVRYEDMKALTGQLENFLLSLPGARIGEGGAVFVEDIKINNIEEVYEHNLGVNRGIIDFTIYV